MGNDELAQSLPCKEEEDEVNLLNHCHGEKMKDEIQGRKHASDSEQPDECAIFSDARFRIPPASRPPSLTG